MGIYGIGGFESFEGATVRLGGLPTPTLAHGRGGGKGVGINGLGLMVGLGWGVNVGTAVALAGTVGFAFKNWSDKQWGGMVHLVELFNGFTGVLKARLSITAQKQLALWSYDAEAGGLLLRAISPEPIRDDAWHYIEFCYGAGGGDSCDEPSGGLVEVGVNGRLFASFTGSTDICPEDDHGDEFHPWRGVTTFHIGVLFGFLNEDRHMSFDDVYSSHAIQFVGDVFAAELALEADDDLQEWTPVPGPTHKGMVNEDPPDDASTYNAHQDVGYKRDSFSVVDVPGQPGGGGQPLAVQLSARMRKTRTSIWRYQPWLFVDPYICYHLGEPLTFDAWTNMITRVFWEAPGPPIPPSYFYIAGHDWTWEEVQAMKVGYVAWPPNAYISGYLGDNFPAVFIQI